MAKYRYNAKTDEVECFDSSIGRGSPDVYFKEPGYHEHLMDEKDPKTWENGTYINSRRHKAEVMRKLKVHESGDRIHGSRILEKRRLYA